MDLWETDGKERLSTLLVGSCLLLWLGLLIVGLWPFNFFPRNRVVWIATSGLHFEGYGQVYSRNPLRLNSRSQAGAGAGNREFTIELWVIPQSAYSTFNSILCVCDSSQNGDLMIAQSADDLVLKGWFHDVNGNSALRSLWFDDAARTAEPTFLSISSGPEGTSLFLNGKPERPNQYRALLPDSYFGNLLLGHSPSGEQSWSGKILGVAFYDRSLSRKDVALHYQLWQERRTELLSSARALYPFDEGAGDIVHNRAASIAPDLLIPTRFKRFRPRILEFPHPFKRSDVEDTIVNILGFVPFGFLLSLYLQDVKGFPKPEVVLFSIVSGAITSLFIELAQVLLPTRDSSALDLINNVVGTLAGSLLATATRD